ncbi:MAG: hypothetical protein D3924_10675, partial [Candidatus Electrothrix sp. AR4]|nr:hypothetical protein [Candidatus Electrothrix sp. AR4]
MNFFLLFLVISSTLLLQNTARAVSVGSNSQQAKVYLNSGVELTSKPNKQNARINPGKKIRPKETWLQALQDDTYLTPETLTILFEETGTDITYRLTDQSLKAVEKTYPFITDKQYKELESKKDEDFTEGDATWTKVAGLLARLELLRQGLTSRYIVQDNLLVKLEEDEIPNYILSALAEKKGTVYFDLSMLKKSFQQQIREKILGYKQEVMAEANFLNMVYFLNENSFLILKGKGLPEELVDSLAPLKDQYYLSKSKLGRDVRKILAQFVDTAELSWLKKIVEIAEQVGRLYMIKGSALQRLLIKLPPKVVGDIRKQNRQGFTAEALCATLQKTPTLLQNYFRRNPNLIPSLGVQVTTEYKPTLSKAARIQELGVSPVVAAAVETLNGTTYPTKEAYVRALHRLVSAAEAKPKIANFPDTEQSEESEITPFISQTAQALFDLEPKSYTPVPIQLKPGNQLKPGDQLEPGNCGCVTVQEGSTYALYPYWTAQGSPQLIDFSTVSRLAYFYLNLDKGLPKKGKGIKKSDDWQLHWREEYGNFINKARKHKTKVDVVLHTKQWSSLTGLNTCSGDRNAEEFVDIVTNLLAPKLEDNLLNRLKPYVSLGKVPMPTLGDGVIIYLTDLPQDSSCFLSFVKILRKRLQTPVRDTSLEARIAHLFGKVPTREPNRRVSLMLPDDLLLAEKWPQNLIDFLREIADTPEGYFDDIVVLLGNKPLQREEAIRMGIEQQLDGNHPVTINKKIIPLP